MNQSRRPVEPPRGPSAVAAPGCVDRTVSRLGRHARYPNHQRVLDNFGCSDAFSQDVTSSFPPPPAISFIGDTTSCAPLQASFDPTIIGVVDSVVWTFGQGAVRTIRDFVHDPILFGYFEPGTYTIGVTAYGPGGNDVAETQTVVVLDQVNAGFSIFPAECVEVGDVVEFTPNFTMRTPSTAGNLGMAPKSRHRNGTIVTHTYSEASSPVITLTIQNALCIDSTSRTACVIEFEGGSIGRAERLLADVWRRRQRRPSLRRR